MKKLFVVALVSLLTFNGFSQNTDEEKTSDFTLGLHFSLGNSLLNTEELRNLQGSLASTGISLDYDFLESKTGYTNFRLSTGVFSTSYGSNVFTTQDPQASLIVEYIRVPLTFSSVYNLHSEDSKFINNARLISGIGGFANFIYRAELGTVEETLEIDDIDTGLGILFNLGVEYDVSSRFMVALNFEYSGMGDDNKPDEFNFVSSAFDLGVKYRL